MPQSQAKPTTTSNSSLLELVKADILSGSLVLPTLPEVAVHIRDAVQDESATPASIAGILSKDPAIALKIIQIANSPLYRTSTEVTDIPTAVSRLGLKLIVNLVVCLAIEQMYQPCNPALIKPLHKIWSHSVSAGCLCFAIGQPIKGISEQEAMLVGLLHESGKLPMLSYLGNSGLTGDLDRTLTAVESDHPVIAEILLKHLTFPMKVAEPIVCLYDPLTSESSSFLLILLVAHALLGEALPSATISKLNDVLLERWGLSLDDFLENDTIKEKALTVKKTFGL